MTVEVKAANDAARRAVRFASNEYFQPTGGGLIWPRARRTWRCFAEYLPPTPMGSGQVCSPAPASRRGKSALRRLPDGAPSPRVVRRTANHQLGSQLILAPVPKRRRRRSGRLQADLVPSLITVLQGRSASRPAHCPAVHDATHLCTRSTRGCSPGGTTVSHLTHKASGQARSVATLRAVIGDSFKSSPEAFRSPSPLFRHCRSGYL
jgi:hypothetical protein